MYFGRFKLQRWTLVIEDSGEVLCFHCKYGFCDDGSGGGGGRLTRSFAAVGERVLVGVYTVDICYDVVER